MSSNKSECASDHTDKLSFSKEEDQEDKPLGVKRMKSPTIMILQANSLHSIGELLLHTKFDQSIH